MQTNSKYTILDDVDLKIKGKRLIIISVVIGILFIFPFLVRFIREGVLGLPADLSDNFRFVIFIFIPLQLLIFGISIYIAIRVVSNWSNLKNIWARLIPLVVSISIISFWVYSILMILNHAQT